MHLTWRKGKKIKKDNGEGSSVGYGEGEGKCMPSACMSMCVRRCESRSIKTSLFGKNNPNWYSVICQSCIFTSGQSIRRNRSNEKIFFRDFRISLFLGLIFHSKSHSTAVTHSRRRSNPMGPVRSRSLQFFRVGMGGVGHLFRWGDAAKDVGEGKKIQF